MATKNVSGKSGLTLKHKIGYAMGDLGGCMTFALMGSMVTRYYTNILQVDTRILAALLLIWNIWDAVNDPLMGILMDRMYAKSRNPKGKFRPWLIRIAPLLCVTFIAFWTLPTLFDGFAMLVVLFFCKILYEGCYTMFNIPMGSLLGAMANNDAERSTLSSARGPCGKCASHDNPASAAGSIRRYLLCLRSGSRHLRPHRLCLLSAPLLLD